MLWKKVIGDWVRTSLIVIYVALVIVCFVSVFGELMKVPTAITQYRNNKFPRFTLTSFSSPKNFANGLNRLKHTLSVVWIQLYVISGSYPRRSKSMMKWSNSNWIMLVQTPHTPYTIFNHTHHSIKHTKVLPRRLIHKMTQMADYLGSAPYLRHSLFSAQSQSLPLPTFILFLSK